MALAGRPRPHRLRHRGRARAPDPEPAAHLGVVRGGGWRCAVDDGRRDGPAEHRVRLQPRADPDPPRRARALGIPGGLDSTEGFRRAPPTSVVARHRAAARRPEIGRKEATTMRSQPWLTARNLIAAILAVTLAGCGPAAVSATTEPTAATTQRLEPTAGPATPEPTVPVQPPRSQASTDMPAGYRAGRTLSFGFGLVAGDVLM